ncbi:hypothetical protein HY995_02445 [Candidatus Micrarchaeota archaeon]|nr:hypothetical protein [Candidatus Micrarchaeota archaeon]
MGKTVALADKSGRVIFASPGQIAATDGMLVRRPNRRIELPFFISKYAIRQSAASLVDGGGNPVVKQPQYAYLRDPRNKSLPVSETRREEVVSFLSRLPLIGKAIRKQAVRKDLWAREMSELLGRHGSIYIKPAALTGSGKFVCRVSISGGKLVISTSDESLASKLAQAGVKNEDGDFVIAKGNRAELLSGFERFVRDDYLGILAVSGRSAEMIAEQEIPSETVDGGKVDFRYLCQLYGETYRTPATYAKIGRPGGTVANIGPVGKGKPTISTLAKIIAARFQDRPRPDILRAARELHSQMKRQSELISNRLIADALATHASRHPLLNPLKNPAKPLLMAVDFAIVYDERGKTFEPWLTEVNQGNVTITGLATANPRKYRQVLEQHAKGLASRVDAYARKERRPETRSV